MDVVLNESNFLDYGATYLCKKFNCSLDVIINMSGLSHLKPYEGEIKDHTLEEIFGQFDQFLSIDTRIGTGSYYTPFPLAQTIVKNAFFDYFHKNNILSESSCEAVFYRHDCSFEIENKHMLIQSLSNLKIADIACGSGVFLVATIDLLTTLYETLGCHHKILSIFDQISGYDLQSFPLEVLKLWFVGISLSHACFKPILFRVYQTDSLLEDIHEGFDLVIGNPPYIGEKGNKDMFLKYKHLPGYEGRMDLFYFFIYKGMAILKDDGILSYITTNYFITADGASGLRLFFKNKTKFIRLINLDECKLFKSAKGMHNMIFTITKSFMSETKIQILKHVKKYDPKILQSYLYTIDHDALFSEDQNIVLYESSDHVSIINKILMKSSKRLSDYVQINQGIVSGADKVSGLMIEKKLSSETIKTHNILKNQGIFVLPKDQMTSNYLRPFFKNSHIGSYFVKDQQDEVLLYLTDEDDLEIDSVEWQHMVKYKEVLDLRREVKLGKRLWYALQWYRSPDIFTGEKIVAPQRALANDFAYHNGELYASADVYYMTKGPLKYLTGILNSRVYFFWLYNRGKRKGQQLELYAKPLSQIPVPDLPKEDQECIENLVDQILKSKKREPYQSEIDEILFRYFEFSEAEQIIIKQMRKEEANDA